MHDPQNPRDPQDGKDRVKVVDRRAFTPDGHRRLPDQEPAPQTEPQEAAAAQTIKGEGFELKPPKSRKPEESLPAVQFNAFIVSLASTAFIHLGELADPVTGKSELNLEGARQMIDILDLLKEKTRGNLDAAETELIQGVLYELKLKFASKASSK